MSHVYLAGAVAASWSLTQEVAGLNAFTVMTNIFVIEFVEKSNVCFDYCLKSKTPKIDERLKSVESILQNSCHR